MLIAAFVSVENIKNGNNSKASPINITEHVIFRCFIRHTPFLSAFVFPYQLFPLMTCRIDEWNFLSISACFLIFYYTTICSLFPFLTKISIFYHLISGKKFSLCIILSCCVIRLDCRILTELFYFQKRPNDFSLE